MHGWADTMEEQVENIAYTKKTKVCWFKCVYCGLEDEDLCRIKDHMVGIKQKKRFWRVGCEERIDLDKIPNKSKIPDTDFPRIFPWATVVYSGEKDLGPTQDFSNEISDKMVKQWEDHMIHRRKPSCRPLPGVRA